MDVGLMGGQATGQMARWMDKDYKFMGANKHFYI